MGTELSRNPRFLAAVKLYEEGSLSAGKAAREADMGRVAFLRELATIGVPAINLKAEEVEAEIEAARDLANLGPGRGHGG
jgi:predicted HTH domain antitoxin